MGEGVTTWTSYAGLPSDEALSTLDALLICEPLKPWGAPLNERDVARLRSWAKTDERRMLIIDSAYATPPTARTLELLHDESAIVLVSLSKGWLIPDHGGLCITPHRFQKDAREAFAALPKDEERLRIAYAALTEHADRPKEVARQLTVLAARLDEFTGTRPRLSASKCTGYFAVAQRSFTSLLEEGVLAVPASVFGAPEGTPRCVLSSLRR
jgi:aspartate/methionine/tyrosine aminotransferase